jgi:hypothetical protein
MYNKLLYLRLLLFCFFLISIAVVPAMAQTQYAKSVVSSNSVRNSTMAIDGATETAALLESPLIGAARMRLGFTSLAPAGKTAGILMRPNSPVVVGLLNNITVRTFIQGNSTYQESFPLDQLLTINLQNATPTMVVFTPQKAFDQIELIVGGLVNLGVDMELYEAFAGFIPVPLPVKLTTFAGQITPAGVSLAWETATEHNTAHFVVERAESASAEFRALGQVKSAGNSLEARRYQFVDATPGELRYYRLRQVDLDGRESFSPVVAVQPEPRSARLAAYPSPATGILTVSGAAGTRVSIYDRMGHHVQTAEISLAQVQQVDVRSLPNGVYFVHNATTGERTKFVKATGTED